MELLRGIVHHISDQLNLMGLFYDTEVTMISNRLVNIRAHETRLSDIEQWDAK
jgi:hypothetical protein